MTPLRGENHGPASPRTRATSIGAALATVRAARGQARQFWRVFSISRVPMVVVDNDRRYLAANVAARLLSRLSGDEFLSRRIEDLTPPRMRWTLHEQWKRLMGGSAVFGSFDLRFPDGSELQIVYGAVANVLPAHHLIVFAPADWPGEELDVAEEPTAGSLRGPLSPREREVLSLIAAGAGIEQIADELVISTATARTHTRNGLRKLGAHNRAHAIALALSEGMIDAPGSSLERTASPD